MELRTTCHNDATGRRLALALAAALSAGCSLNVSGLPAGAGGAGGEGGAVSTSSSSVTSSSATGPCTPMGDEICADGIDNDCNMATDCEDDACKAGFVCIPAIPTGWSAVAFNAQGRQECPAGYAMAADVVSAPSTDSACACTCTEQTAASCSEGIIGIASNGAGACPLSPNIFLDANGSSCGNFNNSTVKNGNVKIAPLLPTQGTCSANVAKTFLPPIEGRSCSGAAVGAGCPGGGACVTNLSAPFVSCIAHDGAAPCPPAFPKGTSVGTSSDDMRDCSPCSCGTSATCSNPKLTLFRGDFCTLGTHDLPVTNACDPVNDGDGEFYRSFRYTAVVENDACGETVDTAPIGSLVFSGERTICCQ